MNYDWQLDIWRGNGPGTAFLPPALVEEASWDILLALRSNDSSTLSLEKLGCLVSVDSQVLAKWLSLLEQRQLIAATRHGFMQELRAELTPAGRALLDRYLSVTSDLQTAAQA